MVVFFFSMVQKKGNEILYVLTKNIFSTFLSYFVVEGVLHVDLPHTKVLIKKIDNFFFHFNKMLFFLLFPFP